MDSGASFNFGSGTEIGTLSLNGGASAAILSKTDGVAAAAQVSQLGLSVGSTLNIGQGSLLLSYAAGADSIATIQGYLKSGYNGGLWNGSGINSSFAATHPGYGVAAADGADGIVAGLASGQILIQPALVGDADLSGDVNYSDFSDLVTHFGRAGGWDQGNFLYDSTIDAADFAALAENFTSPDSLTSSQLAAMDQFASQVNLSLTANAGGVGFTVSSVPEPASAGLLAAAGMGLLARRRRPTR